MLLLILTWLLLSTLSPSFARSLSPSVPVYVCLLRPTRRLSTFCINLTIFSTAQQNVSKRIKAIWDGFYLILHHILIVLMKSTTYTSMYIVSSSLASFLRLFRLLAHSLPYLSIINKDNLIRRAKHSRPFFSLPLPFCTVQYEKTVLQSRTGRAMKSEKIERGSETMVSIYWLVYDAIQSIARSPSSKCLTYRNSRHNRKDVAIK